MNRFNGRGKGRRELRSSGGTAIRRRRMLYETLETRRVLAGPGPEVLTITRLDADPTAAASVEFQVLFDEAVTGVDTSDFQLNTAGISGASVESISGSGSTFVVTANAGTGNGTLKLDLIDDDTILNASNKPLGGSGTTGTKDGSFLTGQTYTIETSTAQGQVWSDDNNDGIRNNNEPGLAGITVFADLNADGVRDAGEPFTTTLADDPVTTGVDETGNYVLERLAVQDHTIAIDLSGNTKQASPRSAASSGTLTHFEALNRPPQSGGRWPRDVVVSPDGQFVLIGLDQGRRISTYSRRVQDGKLTFLSEIYDTSLYGLRRSAFSPDGRFLFTASEFSGAISVFTMDSAGSLTFAQAITITDDANLERVFSLAVAPDGSQLFATSPNAKTFLIYNIDPATGAITLTQTFKEGVDGINGLLTTPNQARVSPDGNLVVVAGQGTLNPLALFDRDPATGVLTARPAPLSLGANLDVVFSDDGKFIYVADANGQLWTLTRDLQSGDVQVDSAVQLGSIRLNRLVMRPDQTALYAISDDSDKLLSFDRDPITGTVTTDQTIEHGIDVSGLEAPFGVAISPDGEHLYAAVLGSSKVQTFWTNPIGRQPTAYDITTALGQTQSNLDFGVAIASPNVVDITTATPNPASTDVVQFVVTFDESVTGVGADDFQLYASGLDPVAITSVTGGPTQYTVSVNTPEYSGNVQIQLVDNDTIFDTDGVPLGNIGTGAVAGRSLPLSIDSKPPEIITIASPGSIVAGATTVDFSITFSEAISGLDAGDFSTVDTGSITSTVNSVVTTSDASVYQVVVGITGTDGSVTLHLSDDDSIVDSLSNVLGGTGISGAPSGDGSFDSSPVDLAATSISGRVWFDTNQDGLFDYNERGRAGVTVYVDINSNAIFDTGEPSAVTVADDPATANVDESGNYSLDGLADSTTYQVRFDLGSFQQTSPVSYSQDTGTLTFSDSIFGGSSVLDTLYTLDGMTFSNDGKHLYAMSPYGEKIALYGRSSVADPFVFIESWSDVTPGFSGLDSPFDLQFDHEDRFGYVVAENDIFVVQRNAETGVLTGIDRVVDADSDQASTDTIVSVDISTDGRYLYTLGRYAETLSAYRIDQSTGMLTLAHRLEPGVDGFPGVDFPDEVKVTPDATQVFVHSRRDQQLSIFDVTPGSGRLVKVQSISPIQNAGDIAFSSDGNFAYSGSRINGDIAIYARDGVTGDWSLVSSLDYGAVYTWDLEVSADGRFLYTTDWGANSVAVYSRDSQTGALTLIETINDVAPHDSLGGAEFIRLSSDGREVFIGASNDHSVTRFIRKSGAITATAFETTTTYQITPNVDFGVYNQPPSAVSLTTAVPSPTSSSSIDFTLTFDESVTGLDTSDFTIDTVGMIGAAVTSVTGSGTNYTVTIASGIGEGNLLLNLIDNGTILDASGSSLDGAADGSLSSASITLDTLVPTVDSIVGSPAVAGSIDFVVTFSEDVTGVNLADFDLDVIGMSGASLTTVTPNSASVYTVTVAIGSGDGSIALTLNDDDSIVDGIGLPVGGVGIGNGNVSSTPISVTTTGKIGGQIVQDTDEDGYADLGEIGIPGITVFVDLNENGQVDAGEPVAISVVDDPATTAVDEAGTYLISGVDPGAYTIGILPPVGWALTNPATRAEPTGNTTFVQAIKDGTSGANYLDEAAGVTTSADGNYLYVASYNDDSVTVFSRNAATGLLTVVQQVVNNVGGVTGLWGAQSIAITADGENLYVASALEDSLVMFDRDPSTGQLTFLGRLKDGVGGVDGLNEAVGVQVSSDGSHLYVAAFADGSVSVFTRDASTGLLSFTHKYVGNTTGAFAAELSPDERHVYVAGANSSAITVYDRNATTGLLTLKQTLRESDATVSGISGVSGMSLSPDGENLYAAGTLGGTIAVFDRDLVTGQLSFSQSVPDPNPVGAARTISVLASPDGHHVVAMHDLYDAITLYRRDPVTGQLTTRQTLRDGFSGVDGLNGAWDAEFSNDGDFLYVVGAYDDAVVTFNRHAGDWVPTYKAPATVSVGETTQLASFTAVNIPPMGISIEYGGAVPITANSFDIDIMFSEPVVGFDAADISFSGSLTSASVTNLVNAGDRYTATISVGAEQGTLIVTVNDNGTIDDAFGLQLGGPAIGDGTFSSASLDVDVLPPSVASIVALQSSNTSMRHVEFLVMFSEEVTQVDTTDFQVISSGLTDVNIESVTGSGDTYSVAITNTGGTGTIGLNLVDNDSIVDAVGHPIGGVGTGNGNFAGEVQFVQPAIVTGRIYRDDDDDGYQDASEPGIAGVTIYIDTNGNEVRDAGEPFVLSLADEPATTDIDETGDYSIALETTGPTIIAVDFTSSQYVQTSPRQYANGTGAPTHQQTITTDPLLTTVFGRYGATVSPDGNFVAIEVTNDAAGGVSIFQQLPDGTLHLKHWYPAGTFANFGDPQSVTFSPDGQFLYLYAKQSQHVLTFDFDPSDGSMTLRSSLDLSAAGITSTASIGWEISADGKNLYATSYSESNVRVFGVDPLTGTVTFLQTLSDFGATSNLQNASGVTVSPDGRHVYVGSFAEYVINVFDRDPVDGTLTLIQELPDVQRPSRLLSSADGQFIIVSGQNTFNGQDLITLSRDPDTGMVSVLSRRTMPSTPIGASLAPDGRALHFADDDYANLTTLTRDPNTSAFTAIDVLTDDVDVVGMRGIDDTVVSPDGKYLYAVTGFERNLHVFTRDQGTRSEIPYQGDLVFGTQAETFNFGIRNPAPIVVSSVSSEPDPTTASAASVTIEFSEGVSGFGVSDLALSPATLLAFPTASIDSVNNGPTIYSVSITGLAGTGQVELILDDDDSIIDVLGKPLDGVGTGSVDLITFVVDNVPPVVASWLPNFGTSTTASTTAYTVTFSEIVSGVDLTDFQLSVAGVTGASISDVSGSGDTYTITVNTGSGDGTLTLTLADNDSIVDHVGLPLGGSGSGNGDSDSNAIQILKTGVIAGRLWHDWIENGQQDPAEPSLPGVTVYLDLNGNGQLDLPAEPTVTTANDDPLTTGIDETGQYQFTSLDPGAYLVRVASSDWSMLASFDWGAVTASTYLDQTNFVANNKSTRISPDGRHLYVFDHVTDAIVVLRMPQTLTESLTEIQALTDQFTDASNATGDIAFTPDGTYMYMTEDQTERLVVYQRNVTDGTLVRTQQLFVPDVGPYSLEVSPDGKHLYVGGGYVAPYSINPTDGTLTALANTSAPARVQDIVFNSDGTRLYASDYGNVVIRVYSRDPATGSITQLQATGSQHATSLYSNWSLEISADDRDVYVAAPLYDIIWHFQTLADGTLDYKGHYLLDVDGKRDLPMDLQLSSDGKILFAALGLNDAIQLLHRDPSDGSLTIGPVYGTIDSSLTNIYENSSSLMAISSSGDMIVRVNNRAKQIDVYRSAAVDVLEVTVAADQTVNGDVGVTSPAPQLVSITSSAVSPSTSETLEFEITFDTAVTGVDSSDFRIASSAITGAVIDSVVGNGTTYTVTVNLNVAYGQGDFSIELIDDDSIVNALAIPLQGFGVQNAIAVSPTITVDLLAPTLSTLVLATNTSSAVTYTATFSDSVTGVDVSDFVIASTSVTGLTIASVTGSGNVYTVTMDISSAVGQGDVIMRLKDDDTIINGRSIPLGGVGLSDNVGQADAILIDIVNPEVLSIAASPSPLLDIADILFVVTFSEPVTGVDATDFSISQIGVSGTSILSFTGLTGGTIYEVLVDSGSSDGTIQLLLNDDDTIIDVVGNPLGGTGAGNGNFASEIVTVERFPRRDIVGHVFADQANFGVRDAGEPGVAGGIVYLDNNQNGQRDGNEPFAVTFDDDPETVGIDETGYYRLGNIYLGQYKVRFEPSVRWLGGNDSVRDVTLEFATTEAVADLGVTENFATIEGHVFDDLDQDGVLDAGEVGLSGWTVYLDINQNSQLDSGEPNQLTAADDGGTPEDESGFYSFSPVGLRTYQVRVVTRPDFFMTTATSFLHTLNATTSVETANFGTTPNLTRIGGAVFDDLNADGIRSAGEPGLVNWTVFLDDNLNGQWDAGEPTMQTLADDPVTTSVNEAGMFEFATLALETYVVYATVPVEYIATSQNPISISFIATTDTADVSFALTTNDTTISGVVFDDFDRSGSRDAGEAGVSGATVYLDANDNGKLNLGEPVQVTDADGRYEFLHVIPGDYVVRVSVPIRHELTGPRNQLRERVFLWREDSYLREIDSQTGDTLKETDKGSTFVSALAFDGQWLWALDQGPVSQNHQTLLKINPDTHNIVVSISIFAEGNFVGLAAVEGAVYAIETNSNQLYRLNALTNGLDAVFDLATLNAGSPHIDGTLILSGAVGESADGKSILLETSTGRWLSVDPDTGIVTGHVDFVSEISDGLSGSTGSIYVGDESAKQVRVYDDQGTLLRTMDINIGPDAMASGLSFEPSYQVSPALDDVITDLNFGARYFGVDITGTQFDDLNDNGVQDAGEPALPGVTVFADFNDNGFPDPDEPQTQSAKDGSYTFARLAPGTFTVRALSPQHYRPSDSYPSRERLFGISDLESGIDNTSTLVLNEFDPLTGAVLSEFTVDQPDTDQTSLTYDGQHLQLVNNDDYHISQLAYNGSIVRQHSFPVPPPGGAYSDFVYSSMVYVDGFLFVVGGSRVADLSLWQVDLYNNNINDLSTADFHDMGPIEVSGLTGDIVYSRRSSTVTADGHSILLGTSVAAPATQQWLRIDPFTQTAILVDDVDAAQSEYGMARLGDEIFVAYEGVTAPKEGQIVVYDNAGNINRSLSGFPTQRGLAGGLYRDNGVVITLAERTSVADLDHSHHLEIASISGNISTDADASGTIDGGEPPLGSVTVYVDLNHNWQFDAGEPTDVTDSDGDYLIAGLVPGRYSVRPVPVAGQDLYAIGEPATRLFTHGIDDNIPYIYEIDPKSGTIINQFAFPGANTTAVGITLHGGDLYVAVEGQLIRMNPDNGDVLQRIPITPGGKDHMVIRDGIAYIANYTSETIDHVDLLRQRVIKSLDLNAINSQYRVTIAWTYGTSVDGDHFIIKTPGDTYKVDFRTGIVVTPPVNGDPYPGRGYHASAGDDYIVGGNRSFTAFKVNFYDVQETFQRSFWTSVPGFTFDLGAEVLPRYEHLVWTPLGEAINTIDFRGITTTNSVSGVQFNDVNANGVQDSGELPLAGVVVFVDSNANGFADAGEPQTISAADGSYTITDVPVGMNLIGAQSPDNYQPTIVGLAEDRLIGIYRKSSSESPTGYFIQLREIDPQSGVSITYTDTDIPFTNAYSTAFDGRRLIIVDNVLDLLFEVGLDGTLLKEVPLTGQNGSPFIAYGPAVIDGTIYILASGGGLPVHLVRYDPNSSEFYGHTPLSRLPGQNPSLASLPIFSLSVSKSADETSIVAFSRYDDRVFTIDPLTAYITAVNELPRTSGGDWSAAAVGGELFLRGSGSQGLVDVYDANFNLLRTIGNPITAGMGGSLFIDANQSVSVAVATATTGLNFGHRSALTTLQGSVWLDPNQNAATDAGEQPDVGARVYLDTNRNGLFDNGEVSTLTDAVGQYTFTELPPRDYVVRVDNPLDLKTLTQANEVALFGVDADGQSNTIRKYDRLTGQLLRQFDAPGPVATIAGLAVDANGLYFISDSQLWVLDPDTGSQRGVMNLPTAIYDGLAAVGGNVFALDGASDSIVKIDPVNLQVIDTFDINTINASHASAPFDLSFNLGESIGGTRLLTRISSSAGGGTLVIHPDTGVIEQRIDTTSGTGGISAAGGEVFSTSGTTIWVETEDRELIRSLSVGFFSDGIAAATLRASEYQVRASADVDFLTLDFFQQIDPASSIEGVFWDDVNEDGLIDAGENLLGGRTVFLDDNQNGQLDAGERSTTTSIDDPATTGIDETGRYVFAEVAPGDHTVAQVLPSFWQPTYPFTQQSNVQHVTANGYVPNQNTGTNKYYDSTASDDGEFIAFSTPNALLTEDTYVGYDVYVQDTSTNQLELISISSDEAVSNGLSLHPVISADGRFVVFRSDSTNFATNDNNNARDIFIRDRQLGTTTLISAVDPTLSTGGSTGNSYSYSPSFSDDGRYVTFWSASSDLVPGDTNGQFDLFLRDLQMGTTERINLAPDGGQATGGNTHSSHLSADGRYVAYWSWATNLVPGDTNGVSDAFVLDRQTGITERVSTTATGIQSDANVYNASISDDGRYVVFHSNATSLDNVLGTIGTQVYLKDRVTGDLRMIGRGPDGRAPNQSSVSPLISGDGRWVVFNSWANNLDKRDPDGGSDAYLYDRERDTVMLLSQSTGVGAGNGRSDYVRISNDGSTVTFNSAATNLTTPPQTGGNLYSVRVDQVTTGVISQTVSVALGQILVEVDFGSHYVPVAPTDIVLSNDAINENTDVSATDVLFSQLSAVDADTPIGHTYQLVSGVDDADNAKFSVVGDELFIKQGQVIDYETQSSYKLRLKVTDSSGLTLEIPVRLDVNDLVEMEPIALGGGVSQRSSLNSIELNFDVPIEIDPGAFVVQHRDSGVNVDVVVALDISSGSTVATLTFAGNYSEASGSLVDGNYQLTIDGSKIRSTINGMNLDVDGTGVAGGLYLFGDEAADGFFRLFGDSDGDRDGDGQDYGRFGLSFLRSQGQSGFDAAFDSDGDGDVDGLDYSNFRRRFMRSL